MELEWLKRVGYTLTAPGNSSERYAVYTFKLTKVDTSLTICIMEQEKLNTELIQNKMREKGLSQSSIADKVNVSREAVSKWIKNESFPRPRLLLKLSLLLDLNFDQLVNSSKENEPVIAFRKAGGTKTTNEHIERAKDMGSMLENLVKYLPFDILSQPSSLISPKLDMEYIIKSAGEVRKQMNLSSNIIDIEDIIIFFEDLHAILIPIMWGEKNKHENALHIYLPESKTTWIYLNLDTKVVDFKFWMAHELGHVKAPELEVDTAEIFADDFAAELLFPIQIAEQKYELLKSERDKGTLIAKIRKIAEDFLISPITIYKQLNTYAELNQKRNFDINFYPSTTNFNKEFFTLTEVLFGTATPAPINYIRITEEKFKTCIFSILKQYIKEEEKGPGFVHRLLNTPVLDAREIHKALLIDGN